MIHPEVWSFQPPQSSISHSEDKHSVATVSSLINSHHFNHLVSVVLPDTLNVPDTISKSLTTDSDYYKVLSVPIYEFVDRNFIENFITKGELSALSINTRIDVDNCVCITPSKKLVLVLNKVTFEELGLEGKAAVNCKKEKNCFYVVINLDGKLDGKLFARVQECLRKRLDLKLDFIIAWEPPDVTMCPSSIAAYFNSKNYSVHLSKPKFFKQHAYNVTVPSLSLNETTDVIDWLGAVCHSAQLDKENSFLCDYLNNYYEGESFGQVAVLNWYGFFTTEKINKLFENLRSFINQTENVPWCSLHVQGFDDSPLTFSDRQHCFFSHGDNMYTVFISHDNLYRVSSLSSSHKRHKRKK